MDRRNFLRSMLGVAAATALPSEVWPFRKIFTFTTRSQYVTAPSFEYIVMPDMLSDIGYYVPDLPMGSFFNLERSTYPGRLTAAGTLQQIEQAERKVNDVMARVVQEHLYEISRG